MKNLQILIVALLFFSSAALFAGSDTPSGPDAPTISGVEAVSNQDQRAYISGSESNIEYSLNNGSWQSYSSSGILISQSSGDQTYTLKARQTDSEGNISPESTVSFRIDKVAPSVSAGSDVSSEGTGTLNGSASDSNGIASYQWTKVSGSGTISFGSSTSEDTTVSASSAGSYVLRLTATDNAGNSASDTVNFTKQAAGPEIDLFQGSAISSGSSYSFTSVKEGESGMAVTFTIKNNGGSNLSVTNITLSDSTNFTFSGSKSFTLSANAQRTFTVTFNPSTSGSKSSTLRIYSNDSNEGTYSVTLNGTGLDGTPPSAPSVNSSSPSTDNTPTWTWSSSSDAVTYRISWTNGSGWAETTATSYTPSSALSNGTYTLYVQAADAAGNWSNSGSKSVTVQAQSDTTGPSVSSTTPSNGATGVSGSTSIVINFNEAIDASTISGSVKVNGTTASVQMISSTQIEATPSSTLSGTCNVVIDNTITDVAGNPMENDYSFSFSAGDTGGGLKVSLHYYDKGTFDKNYSDYDSAFTDNYTDQNVEIHSWIVVEFNKDVKASTINSSNIEIKRMQMDDTSENNYNIVSGTFELISSKKAIFKPNVLYYANSGGTFDWNNPNWNGMKPNYTYSVTLSNSIQSTSGDSFGDDSGDYWEFKTIDIDYGIYFFKNSTEAVKYVPGREMPSDFYSDSKPTIIYSHGWEKTSVNVQGGNLRDYRREGFFHKPGSFYPSQSQVDLVSIWTNASKNAEGRSWNFAAVYWNQLADDDYANLSKPQMAQAKIWTTAGKNDMSYAIRSYSGSKWSTGNTHSEVNAPTKPVTVIFADIVASALATNYNGDLRLLGHSLGSQVVHGMAYCLYKKHQSGQISDNIFPKRITVVDPYWRDGSENWWKSGSYNPVSTDFGFSSKAPALVTNMIFEAIVNYADSKSINGKTGNFVGEFYDVSQTSDGKVFWVNLGEPNKSGRDLYAITYLKTPWINSSESSTDYLAHKHVNGRLYYLWSYAFSAPSTGFSATTSNANIRSLMNYYNSTKTRFSITSGSGTPTPGDDVYTQYSSSWQQ